jgi:hypothetical protein
MSDAIRGEIAFWLSLANGALQAANAVLVAEGVTSLPLAVVVAVLGAVAAGLLTRRNVVPV